MAFVLETLTDDQREQEGFARTMDDADAGRGMQFVRVWAIDRERNVKVMRTFRGFDRDRGRWKMELHWNSDTILITAFSNGQSRDIREGETGTHKTDVFFEIQELSVPAKLKNKIEEIKDLINEGLEIYCTGLEEYNGKGYTTSPPNINILYPEQPKSAVKLADFNTSH